MLRDARVIPIQRLTWALLATLALGSVSAAEPPATLQDGEKRIALVIGNADYETAPLRNPVNDARAMRDSLSKLGFQVAILENAPQSAIKQAIDEFGDNLQRAGKNTVGLFYYSGHGVQVKGRNYIVPVGAKIRSERQVEYESVDVARWARWRMLPMRSTSSSSMPAATIRSRAAPATRVGAWR